MPAVRSGLLALHTSILLFGMTALFAKLIALPAIEITLIRSVFAALALALFIALTGGRLRLSRGRDYGVAILLGVFLAVHWATYFHAMKVSSVAVGVIALHTFPVMTVFLEPLFHGDRPQPRDVASAVIVLLGIYLLVPAFDLSDDVTQGVLWGLLSALFYSLRNIVQRRYLSHEPARGAQLYQLGIVTLVLVPFASVGMAEPSAREWGLLLILGLIFTAFSHTLFAFSLRHFPAKTVSLVACLQVFYAMIFAALLLSEWPSLWTVTGGLIVVGAAMFESYTAAGSRGRRQDSPVRQA